jgi:hypothetical protein
MNTYLKRTCMTKKIYYIYLLYRLDMTIFQLLTSAMSTSIPVPEFPQQPVLWWPLSDISPNLRPHIGRHIAVKFC